MSLSSNVAQKAAEISDGSSKYKGGLSIFITYDSLWYRVRGFMLFMSIALRALAYGEARVCFYDIDTKSATDDMDRVDTTQGNEH